MTRPLIKILEKILSNCEEILELTRSGDDSEPDVQSSIVFGSLRDAGYKIKDLAEQALARYNSMKSSSGFPEPVANNTRAGRSHSQSSDSAEVTGPAHSTSPDKGFVERAACKVLVVDDDMDVVTYLAHWFEDRGFITNRAYGGEDAIIHISEDPPDLITLDLSMPEQSGVKVFQKLKASTDYRKIPIIVITAVGEPLKKFVNRRLAGPIPEGVLTKPIDLRELSMMVKKVAGIG